MAMRLPTVRSPGAGPAVAVDGEGVTWAGIGFGVSLVLGVLLEPYRARVGLENVVIGYLALVVACAAIGGRTAGVWTAVSAALSYNFFFTTPYRTLHIDSIEQVITVVLLLAAGLLAAGTGRWTRLIQAREYQEARALGLLNEVVETVVSGGDADRLAAHGVLDLLDARRVQVRRGERVTADAGETGAPPETGTMARLGSKGFLAHEHLGGRIRRIRIALPQEGTVAPLRRAGREVGALIIVPGSDRAPSPVVRGALATIAHTLALAGPSALPPMNGQLKRNRDGTWRGLPPVAGDATESGA